MNIKIVSTPVARRILAPFGALALALGLAACGNTTSTGKFSGEKQKVAETISNLQSDATSGNAKKACSNDLSKAVAKRLEAKGSTCVKALESQLKQVDTFTMTVESISVSGSEATAKVKSSWSGKERVSTVSFVKEGGSWKVDSLS